MYNVYIYIWLTIIAPQCNRNALFVFTIIQRNFYMTMIYTALKLNEGSPTSNYLLLTYCWS